MNGKENCSTKLVCSNRVYIFMNVFIIQGYLKFSGGYSVYPGIETDGYRFYIHVYT